MSLDVLRQISKLVHAGATVVGNKPQGSPSLGDDETEFRTLADSVWGSGKTGAHAYGLGQVLSGRSLQEVMQDLGIQPDFTDSSDGRDSSSDRQTAVEFVHRQLPDGGFYFLANRRDRAVQIEGSFRVEGKAPELWDAATGTVRPASYRMEGGRTIVPVNLEPYDAVFVVFRHATHVRSTLIPEPHSDVLTRLEGPWEVRFPPNLGAPSHTSFDELRSWTESSDPGVRYFSGTATYDKRISIPGTWLRKSSRVQLDLGQVKNIAELFVNAHAVAILWKPPFKADITQFLHPGTNQLEIRITNLWPNRLIGDKQPGAHPIAFATYDPFTADSPLLPSGLLGPVRVIGITSPSICPLCASRAQ